MRIVEGTAVTGVRPKDASGRAALVTPRGEVRAPAVVLAGEAYLSRSSLASTASSSRCGR